MNVSERSHPLKATSYRSIVGVLLIVAGGVMFLDRYLKTGWLSLLILPAIGLFLFLMGVRQRHAGLILAGGLLGSTGAGLIAAWGPALQIDGRNLTLISFYPFIKQIGLLSLYLGVGWVVIVITTAAVTSRPAWWALVPGGVLGGFGYCLLFTSLRWVDFALYLLLGTGFSLLLWGMIVRLIGLVIPGCLLLGIGSGLYMAWQNPSVGNGLTQTGVMLLWFALGWALITASGRRFTHEYIWWPLIPGGILAVVGMGLYIGGDPDHAIGFIGNTGSIALMIFGLYLLLMRKGIHH